MEGSVYIRKREFLSIAMGCMPAEGQSLLSFD